MNRKVDERLHREVVDISIAMANWIQSQNLEPKMAIAAMARIIAAMMVDDSPTIKRLTRRYEMFGEMLSKMVSNIWQTYHDEEEE